MTPPPLSMEDESWLSDLLETVDDDRLTAWQRGFIDDIRKRFEANDPGLFISPRMRVQLIKIEQQMEQQ